MTVHVLKCDANYWEDVNSGDKEFEVRKDDREPMYERGDVVVLVYSDGGPSYGTTLIKRIGYLARGGRIPEGFCVFALEPAQQGDNVRAEMAMHRTAVSS